jgi:hypothetical protein
MRGKGRAPIKEVGWVLVVFDVMVDVCCPGSRMAEMEGEGDRREALVAA